MNKKLLLFLAIAATCCLATQLTAQTYHPFPKNDALWYQLAGNGNGGIDNQGYYSVTQHGDSLQNGKRYKKIYSSYYSQGNSSSFICLIREDSAKHIFVKFNTHNRFGFLKDTTEFLMYDFSLKINDSIPLKYFKPSTNDSAFTTCVYIVKSIGSVKTNDGYRKIFSMAMSKTCGYSPVSPYNPPEINYLMEGVGSYLGLLYMTEYPGFESFVSLQCFRDNNFFIFGDGSCKNIAINTMQQGNTLPEIQVYPNPATSQINIQAAPAIKTIRVLNMQGLVMLSLSIKSTEQFLNCALWPPGLYLLQGFDNTGTVVAREKIAVYH